MAKNEFMYQVKIEPMPENKACDPSRLWRLVVYQYEGPSTKVPLFMNVLEENLRFQEACEMTAGIEKGLNRN
jgi:hypothetical protein